MTQISVDGVHHHFAKATDKPVEVLNDVSLTVHSGELVALIGPSGCGKSTLLDMVAGFLRPDQGRVSVGDRLVTGLDPQGRIGYMFARDALLPWRTTIKNVGFGLELAGVEEAEEKARALMASVGLSGFEESYRSQLSQGMRQRAALARTLATEPEVLLLDEPFGALDAQTKVLVQEQFLSLRDSLRTTTLLVTHDLMEAITLADRVIVMSARPGSIKATLDIPFERPRSVMSVRFMPGADEIFRTLWNELRPEVELDGGSRDA